MLDLLETNFKALQADFEKLNGWHNVFARYDDSVYREKKDTKLFYEELKNANLGQTGVDTLVLTSLILKMKQKFTALYGRKLDIAEYELYLNAFAQELALYSVLDDVRNEEICMRTLRIVEQSLRSTLPTCEAFCLEHGNNSNWLENVWVNGKRAFSADIQQEMNDGIKSTKDALLSILTKRKMCALKNTRNMEYQLNLAYQLLRSHDISGILELRDYDHRIRNVERVLQQIAVDVAYVNSKLQAEGSCPIRCEKRVQFVEAPQVLGSAQADVDRTVGEVSIPTSVEMLLIHTKRNLIPNTIY